MTKVRTSERVEKVVEQLATELADLRARNEKVEAELELMRDAAARGLTGYVGADELRDGPKSRRERRRTRSAALDGDQPVSRRRMFGLLGGAAAAGTGIAVVGSALMPQAASAAVAVNLANGTGGVGNDATASVTSITSISGVTWQALNTSTGDAVAAVATGGNALDAENNSTTNATIKANNLSAGYALALDTLDDQPHMNLVPAGTSGHPATGAAGDFYVAGVGELFYCIGGVPGTWVELSRGHNLFMLSAPIRAYDSRPGQPHAGNPTQGPLTFTSAPPAAANRTIICAQDASTGAPIGWNSVVGTPTLLLLNLAIISVSGVGALNVYNSAAPQPATANINWSAAGQVLSNAVTTLCNSATTSVKVAIVAGAGASTHFVIDVIGYSRGSD